MWCNLTKLKIEWRWNRLTNYICEKLIDASNQTTTINNKYVSKTISSNFKGLYNSKALIDIIPTVFGGSEECLRRFEHDSTISDHGRHSHGIKKIVYAFKTKRIICIDNVPKWLFIYDMFGHVLNEIYLDRKKHFNDARIVSFAYSEKEQRIGASNNDYSMSFWDFSDNFKYE